MNRDRESMHSCPNAVSNSWDSVTRSKSPEGGCFSEVVVLREYKFTNTFQITIVGLCRLEILVNKKTNTQKDTSLAYTCCNTQMRFK